MSIPQLTSGDLGRLPAGTTIDTNDEFILVKKDADGIITSTTRIPASLVNPGLGIDDTQVAVGSATGQIEGSSALTFDGDSLGVSSASPKLDLTDENSAANEGRYRIYTVADEIRIAFVSDGGGQVTDALILKRTGSDYEGSIHNGLSRTEGSIALADDAEVLIATGVAGFGRCSIGDSQEYANFSFTAAGVVTLWTDVSTNVVATDTDANLCIYDAGSGIAIKNRLGGELTLRYVVEYS